MSSIDTTGIDATKPAAGEATTASVRDNFSAIKTQLGTAKTELGNLSGVTDKPTARTNIGAGTISTQNADSVSITGGAITGITDITIADGGTGASTAAAARTNLGLVIGTDVQAYDAGLADVAGLTPTDSNVIVGNGTNWIAESGATARTSLGAASVIASPTTGNLISQTAGGDLQDSGVAAADVLTSVATADLPAGTILQVQQTVDTTNRSTTSTTYTDSGVSVTLTPRDTSSKVRVRVSGIASNSATAARSIAFTLYRGATELTPSGVNGLQEALVTSDADASVVSFDFMDSPATASAVTYSLYWKVAADTGHLGRRAIDTSLDSPTIITAEEIAG